MESPAAAAREMAWPMVLHAVEADRQLFVSLPLTPFTYHTVAARRFGARTRNKGRNTLQCVSFMTHPLREMLMARPDNRNWKKPTSSDNRKEEKRTPQNWRKIVLRAPLLVNVKYR